MGNCECLRNNEDPSTEIQADVKFRNYDNDYESTTKGRAKNINNFILNDDEEDQNKNDEPPLKEDHVLQINNEEEPIKEENYEDFAVTFKKERENNHVMAATPEEPAEDKPLDKSGYSGESDIEGSKLFFYQLQPYLIVIKSQKTFSIF